MGPFKLRPFYKDYIWGGVRLKKEYNKATELRSVAESWELSAHKDGSAVIGAASRVDDSPLIGMPFAEFVTRYPESVGVRAAGREFPILIKLIDARDDLSIQVHPDDEYARAHENSPGKTEMWHVLEAGESGSLYVGFNRDVSLEELPGLIKSGEIISVLNKVPVKKGDSFLIDAGTIHAINSGVLLAEIQQNSNLTYRVYDYGRHGADGKPRELHTAKALDVINREKYQRSDAGVEVFAEKGYVEKTLSRCRYFTVKSVILDGVFRYAGSVDTFAAVLVTEGMIDITSDGCAIKAEKGDCVFIPAGKTEPVLSGSAEFLLTTC